MLRSVELFSGAGGLALGIARAGFEHLAVVELDKSAYNTMKENKSRRGILHVESWPIYHDDVREFDYKLVKGEVDLLAGGVPCQPFSIGGKHKGHEDARNMFPDGATMQILNPRAVIVENVRGLARPSFSKYFGYIELMLSYPELTRKRSEDWPAHLARLERYHTKGRRGRPLLQRRPPAAERCGLWPAAKARAAIHGRHSSGPRGRVVVSLADPLCRDITVGAVSDGRIRKHHA